MELNDLSEKDLLEQLNGYLNQFTSCFNRHSQLTYFSAFEKGLLSNLDRKSTEPIALALLDEQSVRGFQQFFTRSNGYDEALKSRYQQLLSETLSTPDGFLSIDGSDFVKKGNRSAGVARQ